MKRLRTLAGLSQAELAALAGVSRSCVARFETGVTVPRGVALRKLCDALLRVGARVAIQQDADGCVRLVETESEQLK